MSSCSNRHTSLPRRSSLALALALGLGMSGFAFGQATTGTLYGSAPESGETVTVQSASGLTRQATVDASGRYSFGNLPLGTYTVTLMKDGQVVDTRNNVTLRVGAGTRVNLSGGGNADATASSPEDLESIQVSANALPAIDVSSTDSRTVITSQELAKLPMARSAESIALLAPGVIPGNGAFTGPTGQSLVSFGGSSVTENAYYINGFNTTDPLSGMGGLTLPYGAIDQQQMLTGGYGAAYGRSDGGVINMIGKRGTNEWHFGGQVLWTPAFAKGNQNDIYYRAGSNAGKIYNRNRDDKSWTTTYDAYVGGPLIKDKLFLFAAMEAERKEGSSVGTVNSPYKTQYQYKMPKWYAKLDWNITDSNILEITGASNKTSYNGTMYDYDYATDTEGDFHGYATETKQGADLWTAKFTSYITDNLTLSALYGQMKGTYYSNIPGYDGDTPYIYAPDQQNPALNGGSPIINDQTTLYLNPSDHKSKNSNLRVDLSYHIGDHTITAGIDNMRISDTNDGQYTSGPEAAPGAGYWWYYHHDDPSKPVSGIPGETGAWAEAPGNYPGGEDGYYVEKYVLRTTASATTSQKAQYIEDEWQINDKWLLKVGLRNDQFTNYNPNGDAYLRLTKPQWAPRIGVSWDVNGDSSFKVYANAGRYYLALPASVALRAAGTSLYTHEYFTYTGIDDEGKPTGLTPIESSTGGPISANREYGQARDPKTAAARDLKSEYQDEFIVGFDKQLNDAWNYGAKASFRKLRTGIDDVADADSILAKMHSMGIADEDIGAIQGSYLINPGMTNTLMIPHASGDGYYAVPMTSADFGFPDMKRNYYSLELYLQHPFDGTWFGKIDYTYARSYGNSEGQVRSDIGQTDVSATEDWDYGSLMQYANGELANSRRHQLKAYGAWQMTPEWMLSGNVLIQSGTPRSCLGGYGPDESNPTGYGNDYHWCGGQPARPGDAGHNPWQYTVNVGVEYRPAFAQHKLAFSLDVNNLFNNRTVLSVDPHYGTSNAVAPTWQRVQYQSTPRYARLGVRYDY